MRHTDISYDRLLRSVEERAIDQTRLRRALVLAGVMRWFARFRGYESSSDRWAAAGLLRAFSNDDEVPGADEIKAAGIDAALLRYVSRNVIADADAQSPLSEDDELSCLLIIIDHLTAIISAMAVTRPRQSVNGLKVSAVQKKFRDHAFAPESSRMLIIQGARRMRWEIGDLTSKTIKAVLSCEDEIRAAAQRIA